MTGEKAGRQACRAVAGVRGSAASGTDRKRQPGACGFLHVRLEGGCRDDGWEWVLVLVACGGWLELETWESEAPVVLCD